MSDTLFTREEIVTWMIEEAAADYNGLHVELLADTTYGITDLEYGTRHVVTVASVSKALTRWAKSVATNADEYCNYWVVAARAVRRADWDDLDYDAGIATYVVDLACSSQHQDAA